MNSNNLNNLFAVNPKSGRMILKSSRLYKQLLKDKLLGVSTETRKSSLLYEGEHAGDIKQNIQKEKNVTLVKRGNKIHKQRRKVTHEEIADNVIKKSMGVILQNQDLFNGSQTDEEIDQILKNLIEQKLIGDIPEHKKEPNISFKLMDTVLSEDEDEGDYSEYLGRAERYSE